jgi:hypothetical protein
MARKRGGLAGIYDRNKKVIKTLAPIAAGFIPGVGPLIGAGIGAAMGGDREGKGYFKGFNTKGAALGGLSGYGGAKLGQAAKGKLSGMFTGQSPLDKLTGAPKMGVMTQTTGPSPYGAIGSYQPSMPTDALLSSPVTRLTGAPKNVDMVQRPEWYGRDGSRHARSKLGQFDGSPEEVYGSGIPQPSLPKGAGAFKGSTNGNSAALGPMNKPPRIGDFTQLAPDQTIESTFGRRPYYNPPTPTLPSGAGRFTGNITPPPDRFNLGSLFGKEGMIEQNKTLLSGVGKGIMGIRNDALDQQAADATLNQRKYEFDKTYGLDAAQEADRKRREEDLMAQRAAFRAMFTGTA